MRFSPILSFEGRSSRLELWLMLPLYGLLLVSALFTSWTTHVPEIEFTFAVLLIYPTLALFARRMHDRGRSAWWMLLGLVPGLGWAWVIAELSILRGERGDNVHGEDPVSEPEWHKYPA